MRFPVAGIDVQPLGGGVVAADQGFGQPMIMMDVIKTEPPFDAKPPFVGGTVDPFDEFDFVIFDLERDLSANTTKRANAFNFLVVVLRVAHLVFVSDGCGQQCACRAGLHAFAASHAVLIMIKCEYPFPMP